MRSMKPEYRPRWSLFTARSKAGVEDPLRGYAAAGNVAPLVLLTITQTMATFRLPGGEKVTPRTGSARADFFAL